MTDERWRSLSDDQSAALTSDEFAAGWHFCAEWDGLLIGPGWTELTFCSCFEQTDPRHKLCVDARAAEDKRLADYDMVECSDDESRKPLDKPPQP